MSLPDDKLIKQDNAFTLQHGHLRSITAFTTTPAASVAEACLGPLLASMKCQYDKVIICVYLFVCLFIHLSIHLYFCIHSCLQLSYSSSPQSIVKAHLLVFMITAGLDDYPIRLALLDQLVTDHHHCDLDVMVDVVKTYSNTVLASDLVCQLQQQISGRTS